MPADPLPPLGTYEQVAVPSVRFAPGRLHDMARQTLAPVRAGHQQEGAITAVAYFVDDYFEPDAVGEWLAAAPGDLILSVPTQKEPSDLSVDAFVELVRSALSSDPCCIVGFGGGITMDTAKAVSNLLRNPGPAAGYQGWDLLKNPGVRKVGIPTISGTGAEASRTCVLTNASTGAKLGMNSRYSVFDSVILDPTLTASVPRDQFFFTGMDTYMHCVESLRGRYRNPIADAYSRQSLALVREVFHSPDMVSEENRTKLMIGSLLGGSAIAGSYVGLIHPMSAALGVVLGTHHGVANCIVMRAMRDYYPEEYTEFWAVAEKQRIEIPSIGGASLPESDLRRLVDSTLVHERPLSNALGVGFREILTPEKLKSLFALL